MESSSNLTFAPYNFKYPQLQPHSEAAAIIGEFKDDEGVTQTKVNKWNLIFDFTEKVDAPNFKLMKADKFKIVDASSLVSDIPQTSPSDFIFELPIEFGGSLDSAQIKEAKDNLMVFDIKTGA